MDSTNSLQMKLLSVLVLSPTALPSYRMHLKPDIWSHPQLRVLAGIILKTYDLTQEIPTREILGHQLDREVSRDKDILQGILTDLYKMSAAEADKIYKHYLEEIIRYSVYESAFQKGLALFKKKDFDAIDEVFNQVHVTSHHEPILQSADMSEADIDLALDDDAPLYGRKGLVRTGFPTYDFMTKGGIGIAEFHLIVAPPNKGKSRWMMNAGKNAAFMGKKIAYVSFEMEAMVCQHRFWQICTGLEIEQLYTKTGRAKVKEHMALLRKCGGDFQVKKFPEYTMTFPDLEAYFQSLDTKFDLIITDYIDLMNVTKKTSGNYFVDQTFLYAEGRRLGKTLNCGHLSACQPVDKPGEVIAMRAASGGKGKGATVDIMASLNSTDEELEQGKQTGFISKNRYGPVNKFFQMHVDAKLNRIREVSYQPDKPPG